MGYVEEPFVYDVFLSYSHGDVDGSGISKLKQWSQAFARELESEFRAVSRFGRDFSLFVDQHHRASQGVDPMAPLTEQLHGDIERSAVLIVLMSPQYLQSTWCADERDWWYAKQRASALPIDDNIAIVRIWPTPERWPDVFLDARGEQLPGFVFFDPTVDESDARPFGWPEPQPKNEDPFSRALVKLVGSVGLKLDKMKNRIQEVKKGEEAAARLKADGGQLVYLHGRVEQAAEWSRAVDVLTASGVTVVPGEPDPVANDTKLLQDIRRQRVEIMSGCDALLLMAGTNGRTVDADLVVVGRQDRNSARAKSNQPLPCALLDGVGAGIATPQRKGTARNLNVEWIDATREPWTPAVQDWLSNAARVESRP